MAMPALDPVLAHVGPWTPDDLDVLGDAMRWAEIVDGALVMAPPPSEPHNIVLMRLGALLEMARPADLVVSANGHLETSASYRSPDVQVYPRAAMPRSGGVPAAEVLLAVEVQSPGSETTDRITKLHEYAAAGVRSYWRVEVEPEPRLVVYALRDGAYVEIADVRGDEAYAASEPFPVTVKPSALLP